MKARQFISSVVTFLIAVLFLFTNTGFNVYIHHCSTSNSSEYAVLTNDFCCGPVDSDHCQDETGSSTLTDKGLVNEDHCCATVAQFLKITVLYLHNPVVNLTGSPLFVELFLHFKTINPLICENLFPADRCYSPPPLMHGFDQLVSIQQLKIPSFS